MGGRCDSGWQHAPGREVPAHPKIIGARSIGHWKSFFCKKKKSGGREDVRNKWTIDPFSNEVSGVP